MYVKTETPSPFISEKNDRCGRFQALNALSAFRGRLNLLQTRPRSVPELPALEAKGGQRVVVVEDNPDSAKSLRKLLELCGYRVYVAYSAADGLRT